MGAEAQEGQRQLHPLHSFYLELAQPPVLAEVQAIHLQTRKVDERMIKRGCKGTGLQAVRKLSISHQGKKVY